MGFPRQSAFNLPQSAAATTPANGDFYRDSEELKSHLENAAQKLVPLRFPGVHPGLNQLRNPSFEVDANGVTPPTGWTVTAGVVMVDTSQFYDGAKSCLIVAAAALNSQLFQTVPLKKGQYVRVSIACKASTASQARVHIELNGGDYSWYAVYSSPHTGGGAWEILSCVFGSVTSDTTAYILARKILDAATDIWFDHAVLEVFDAPVFPISTFNGVNTDTISEKTTNAGVAIETVLVKDGLVDGRDPSVDGVALDKLAPEDWTDYGGTSTLTGWAAGVTANIYYRCIGKLVFVNFYIDGTSNDALSRFTLPYTAKNSSGFFIRTAIYCINNAVASATSGMATLAGNSDLVLLFRDWAALAWTPTGAKRVMGQFWYEKA